MEEDTDMPSSQPAPRLFQIGELSTLAATGAVSDISNVFHLLLLASGVTGAPLDVETAAKNVLLAECNFMEGLDFSSKDIMDVAALTRAQGAAASGGDVAAFQASISQPSPTPSPVPMEEDEREESQVGSQVSEFDKNSAIFD
jgi:hypothetical protein